MSDQLDARVARQISVETAFWESDPFERPGADAVENIVNRGFDAAIFHEIHDALAAIVGASQRIVEVGGGEGSASCLVKRLHPHVHVTLTDAVPAAVSGHGIRERVYGCTLDGVIAAPAQAPSDGGGSRHCITRYCLAYLRLLGCCRARVTSCL